MTTFTRRSQDYDPENDTTTLTETTISGSAIQVSGDLQRYEALGLSVQENKTLFFTPSTYGDTPEVGDEVTWPANDTKYRVRDVETIAPDGVTIAARVVIGK